MSALLLERARPRELVVGAVARQGERTAAGSDRSGEGTLSLFEDLGGGPTLDMIVARVWEGLAAHSVVGCPICGGRMTAAEGGDPGAVSGACGSCGTTLD